MDKIQKIMARWNALLPLSERDRELLSRRFTIDFNYNSNHIEGNTLTYGQTEILLLFGKIVGEAEAKELLYPHRFLCAECCQGRRCERYRG